MIKQTNPYETKYPSKILLDNNEIVEISLEDSKQRPLIIEVDIKEEAIRQAFEQHNFSEVLLLEEKKIKQLGNGMRLHLDELWDIHVRLFELHPGHVAIDGEVETHMQYLEHLSKNNWISVLSELLDMMPGSGKIRLFHKPSGRFVSKILDTMTIQMEKFENQINLKHVLIIIVVALLVGWLISKLK